ncbi:MAG: hypothetical protein ACMG6E_03950 [Candidatus Roizmanbacteria bacterium]
MIFGGDPDVSRPFGGGVLIVLRGSLFNEHRGVIQVVNVLMFVIVEKRKFFVFIH